MKTKLPQSLLDLSQGQIVIIVARWLLILAGLVLLLLNPPSLTVVRFQILFILGLAVANFYLCAQVLMKRKTLEWVIYAASLADIAVITLIVLSQGGFASNTYTFYFPALLAMSVAFNTGVLIFYAGGMIWLYGLISVFTIRHTDDFQTLVIRLLMMMAIPVCGILYQHIEQQRLKQALRPVTILTAEPEPAAS